VTIKVNKKFLKDLAKLPARERQIIEKLVFRDSTALKNIILQ
jgi:mRNA-degrading endonuclease RelE of RelBE toxin-antitoxin system